MKFGVQAAIQGLKFDFSTITSKILSKKIYIKAIIIPAARFKPIPPLFLNEDTATAIIVKISAEMELTTFYSAQINVGLLMDYHFYFQSQ